MDAEAKLADALSGADCDSLTDALGKRVSEAEYDPLGDSLWIALLEEGEDR